MYYASTARPLSCYYSLILMFQWDICFVFPWKGSLTSRTTPSNKSLTARGHYSSVTDIDLAVINEFGSSNQEFIVDELENDAFHDLVVSLQF
jgi:hypothetical protein